MLNDKFVTIRLQKKKIQAQANLQKRDFLKGCYELQRSVILGEKERNRDGWMREGPLPVMQPPVSQHRDGIALDSSPHPLSFARKLLFRFSFLFLVVRLAASANTCKCAVF